MAKNRYYEETYKCPFCGTIQKHWVWSNDILKGVQHECVNEVCDNKFSAAIHVHKAPVIHLPGIKTDTKNRFGR